MALKLFALCVLLAFADSIRINPLEYQDYYEPSPVLHTKVQYAKAAQYVDGHELSNFAKAVNNKYADDANDHHEQAHHEAAQHAHHEGVPGIDFPNFHEFPHTSFDCSHVPVHPGFYANVETGCQGYHVCNDGREGKQGSKFLCTNGTLFSQKKFTCDHWYNVNCAEATHYYDLNADPDQNPYTKDDKKKAAEAEALAQYKSQKYSADYY